MRGLYDEKSEKEKKEIYGKIELVIDNINDEEFKDIITEAFVLLSVDKLKLKELLKKDKFKTILQQFLKIGIMNDESKYCEEYLIFLADAILKTVVRRNIMITDIIKENDYQDEIQLLIKSEIDDSLKEFINKRQIEIELMKYCMLVEYIEHCSVSYLDYDKIMQILMVCDDIYRITNGRYPEESYIKKCLGMLNIDYNSRIRYRDIIKAIIEKPHLGVLIFVNELLDYENYNYKDIIVDSIREYKSIKNSDGNISVDEILNNIKVNEMVNIDDEIDMLEVFKYIFNSKNKQVKIKKNIDKERLLVSYKEVLNNRCNIYDIRKDVIRISSLRTQISAFNMLSNNLKETTKKFNISMKDYKDYYTGKQQRLEGELSEKIKNISNIIDKIIEKNKQGFIGLELKKEELIISSINDKIKDKIDNIDNSKITHSCLKKGSKLDHDTWVFIENGIAYSGVKNWEQIDENILINTISYELRGNILGVINFIMDEYIDDIRFMQEYI